MKVNPRIWVLALVAALFVLSLAFVPGATSASDPKDNKDRSASTKPASKSREAKAESESARERDNRPKPIGAQPSSQEKPGALKRIASFFKDLFVPRNKAAKASEEQDNEEDDPDRPKFLRGNFDEAEYIRLREAHIALLRGVEPDKPFDATARGRAISQMDRQMAELAKAAEQSKGSLQPQAFPNWVELGPNPIPNGQTQGVVNTVSGRVTAIEIDPTDPNKVYVGAAQGGVFRSLDGGTTWTPIFDTAQSLAIGALALDAANGRLYVGTGEANGSADSFAGVGLYRIDNVNTTANLVGPINPVRNYTDASSNPQSVSVFTGRSISKILIVPNDPTTLFVGTAGGVMGIGGDAPFGGTIPPLGLRGLYRLSSVTGAPAGVGVTRIRVSTTGPGGCFDIPCTGNRNINDMVFDPGDATGNTLIVWQNGVNVAGDGGIWRSTNAMTTASFTQSLVTTSTSTSNGRGSLAIYKQAANPAVVYAASGEPNNSGGTSCASTTQSGAMRVSTDGGVTFGAKLAGTGGFCNGQCFYNIGLDVNPGATTAQGDDLVYLGGNVRSTNNCQRLAAKSGDGGATFIDASTSGVHADTHVIKIAPSNSLIIYRGDDGGIWKSNDGGAIWTSLNNTTFRATQFMSIAVHPIDQNFSIGGTQDNGTNNLLTSGTAWNRIDFGDGGFADIDQNATDLVNVVMYHTYFNQSNNLVGFAEVDTVAGATDGNWNFFGCQGVTSANGITCADAVNFYAPMALGPGSPNTHYYGSDRLYRSVNKGVNNTVVSQAPLTVGVPISSIAISPQDDNYRLVGLNNGGLFFTTTGSSTLTSLDPVGGATVIPDRYVGRVFFDPNNKNTAYVCLGGYMGSVTAANSHVWKITNLNTTPVLTGINGTGITGLPDVPINAFAVDPQRSLRLFVGTDIGVFVSENGGTNWSPYGTGLPRVAIFGMAIQNVKRVLRIATHGRGMWEIPLFAPTAADGTVAGTVVDTSGSPVAGVTMQLSGTQNREAITDANGYYNFDNVETNGFYTTTPSRANYTFSPPNRSFSLLGLHTDASFTASANSFLVNAIDTTGYFVRQQYLDFLGREPDQSGFAFWSNEINSCGNDQGCVERKRISVSAAFFLSIEFQQTGYLVYRMNKAAYGNLSGAPVPVAMNEFLPDAREVAQGVVVNQNGWQGVLDRNQQAFISEFVQRARFTTTYPTSMSPAGFVDRLFANSGVSPAAADREAAIGEFGAANDTEDVPARARALRDVAENSALVKGEFNRAFVLMEYFGYLRRDPNTGPDTDFSGYNFWLNKLNAFGNFQDAELVKAFLVSGEYRGRFF